MATKNRKSPRFNKKQRTQLNEAFTTIKSVLAEKNVDIASIIGLVTTDEINNTAKQVEVRLAEPTVMRVMNMVAFD